MALHLVHDLPVAEWRQFIQEHPDSNIFHTPEMFEVFQRTTGFQPELWAVTNGTQILTLMTPVRISLKEGIFQPFTSRAVVFNRLLHYPQGESYEAVDLLMDSYKKEVGKSLLFTRIYNTAGLLQPILDEHGFVYEDGTKYIVNLSQPSEAIFERFDRRVRNSLRRGLRQGKVTIDEVTKLDDLATFYALLTQSAHAKGFAVAEQSLFEHTFDLLSPKGMVKFILARVEGVPAAAYVKLVYKGEIYSWYGGVDRAFRSYRPNELLLWHVIKWGADHGYQVYDFGGSGIQEEGADLSAFKGKFGGETIPFGRHTYEHIPFALGLSQWGYEAYCQLSGMVSSFRRREAEESIPTPAAPAAS